MLFRFFDDAHRLPGPRGAEIFRLPFVGLAATALLALGTVPGADADAPAPRATVVSVVPAPTPKPRIKITKRPHLLAVGPMEIDVAPPAEPRVRRPPLLPRPKPVEEEPATSPAPPQPKDSSLPKPAEPSAFSPDAPLTLLPRQKPSPAPADGKKEGPMGSVLVPSDRGEPELKDAVIYFETPAGPHGARATIPMALPFASPATVPQPESRATYRKEKE